MEAAKSNKNSLWVITDRWPILMSGLALVAGIPVLVHWGAAAALAFVLGAALGTANFHWLHRALYGVLDDPPKKVPKKVVLKVLLRYPLMFALIGLVHWTGWLPALGIIAGLLVPVAGVLLALIAQIFTLRRSS